MDEITEAVMTGFAILIGIVGMLNYGKNRPPPSNGYRGFLITLAISAATQAAIRLLSHAFGDDIPRWQTILLTATLALLLAAMLLAVLTARMRTPAREQSQQRETGQVASQ